MKKVLIITYYWPPSGGSGVQRWLKFAKYLPQYGWQPVIYTPSNPENPATDNSLEKEIPAEAIVIKRPISEPYQAYKKLFGKGGDKGGSAVVNPINQSGKKSFIQRVSLWVRANLFIPDPRTSWVRPSVSYLVKYLEDNPVDAIVSTGPPHSMHLIARGLHRQTGIRWVADFRDPWTEIFYFKHLPMTAWAKRRHKKLEKSVVAEADAVVSVTKQMTADFAALLGGVSARKEKLYTICNGYDEADFISDTPVSPEGDFTLTHTGLFSADGNPINLWKVLGEMCKEDSAFGKHLKLRLIGKVDREVLEAIQTNGLAANLENMGYLPHSQIPTYQQSGWGLLLPLRNEPESKAILTGKFFEYLAAGRPIVAFGPKDGEMAKVLKQTHSGEIFEWDETEALKKYIEDLYQVYKMGMWTTDADRSTISRYSRHSLTGEMVEVLKK